MGFKDDFVNRYLDYAKQAAAAVDMPVSVVLGQWALESDYGRSNRAVNHNNLGGIKYSSNGFGSPVGDGFARYDSIGSYVKDYIRVMKLGYYDKVRAAGGVDDTILELAKSPYDAGHYGGSGKSILNIVKGSGWAEFDNMLMPSSDGPRLDLPQVDNQTLSWLLIGAGVLLMIKVVLGREPVEVAK